VSPNVDEGALGKVGNFLERIPLQEVANLKASERKEIKNIDFETA
jgi:hypothetical protein